MVFSRLLSLNANADPYLTSRQFTKQKQRSNTDFHTGTQECAHIHREKHHQDSKLSPIYFFPMQSCIRFGILLFKNALFLNEKAWRRCMEIARMFTEVDAHIYSPVLKSFTRTHQVLDSLYFCEFSMH